MKVFFTTLFFLLISLISFAQQDGINLLTCGTPPHISDWLKRHQAAPAEFRSGGDTLLWIPHTVHLVGQDDGTGYFPISKTLEALCTLNQDYEPTQIQYFLPGEFHYINNSEWYSHPHVTIGYEMMLANDIPGTVNSYLVSDPSGYCGYNLPYGSVVVKNGCADAAEHTWAHEVGHFLSLPHPFYGWETLDYDFNTPTPFTVINDAYTFFQDTVVWDTTASILDTNYVELMDYSNSTIAADLFTDTRPDYISYRWPCGADNFSNLLQKDPNGVEFHSDGTLIMSYAYDNCQNRFSDEQVIAMRANIFDEYPELLTAYEPLPLVTSTTSIPVTPLPEDIVDPSLVHLEWTATENATHYLLQLTRFSSFAIIEHEILVTTNSADVYDLLENKTYRWRIKAFNSNSFCTTFTEGSLFQTGEINTSTSDFQSDHFRVFPTILKAGSAIQVIPTESVTTDWMIQLYDLKGVEIYRSEAGADAIRTINTENMEYGIYFMALTGKDFGREVYKVVIVQ